MSYLDERVIFEKLTSRNESIFFHNIFQTQKKKIKLKTSCNELFMFEKLIKSTTDQNHELSTLN